MGQNLSKEAIFIKDLKTSLKEGGVKVKKKDLVNFFLFIDKKCPWFIISGPEIHSLKWQKVGRELNDLLINEGQSAVSATIFSYWGLIRDIVEGSNSDPQKRQLLFLAEYCLRPLSRAASEASIHSLPQENRSTQVSPA